MSTDGVNASPGDVKKLAAALTRYQRDVGPPARLSRAHSTVLTGMTAKRISSRPDIATYRRPSIDSCRPRFRRW